MSGVKATSQSIAEYVRCVCGCTSFTKSDLESMLFANMDGFINNPTSVKFFRNVADQDPNSHTLRALRCFELCRDITYNELKVNDDEKEELLDLCPTYLWEQRFEAALEEPDTELEHFLNALMTECKFQIEKSKDYQRYRELLRDKCKKLTSLSKKS